MTSPALLRLREAYPRAHITLLTEDKLADLWQRHPAVNSIRTFTHGQSAFSIARSLPSGGFDLGLVLPNSFRSALELWLGRIPIRVGYGGQLRQCLLTHAAPRPVEAWPMRKRTRREIVRMVTQEDQAAAGRAGVERKAAGSRGSDAHHIYHYLRLTAHLGAADTSSAPQLFVGADEVQAVLRRFGLNDVPDSPLFGLNPGAEYGPAKRWPVERFISAAREIQDRTHCRWLILGGKGDADLANTVAAGLQQAPGMRRRGASVMSLAGATSLRELCAVLQACRVLLTNDTGPMHVAAAVGTPVVAPFGSTSPELTGPGAPDDPRHRVLRGMAPCAPCFLRSCPIDFRCMDSISVESVVQAVLSAVGQI
jgi:heptosyltransferase-2